MITGKCFSQFSLNHNKSQLFFISSSQHKNFRNMNLEVFSKVVMRLGFQLVFSDNKMHILKKKNIPTIQLQRTYMLSNHPFLLSSHFSSFFFLLFMIFNMISFSFFFFSLIFINRNKFFLFSTFCAFSNQNQPFIFYMYCIYVLLP